MPTFPASCFTSRVDPEGETFVEIHCPACAQVARIYTEQALLPLCVHNSSSCPLARANFWPKQEEAKSLLSTESTAPTTTA